MTTTWNYPPPNRPLGATTLAEGVDTGATSLTLVTGGAAALGITTLYPLRLTLFEDDLDINEIVVVTGRTGDVLALESPTTSAWGTSATCNVQRLLTYDDLREIQLAISAIETTWIGQEYISKLGTVTTGVWNAGAITSSGIIIGNDGNIQSRKQDNPAVLYAITARASAGGSQIIGRASRGTLASPTQSQAGDEVLQIYGQAYNNAATPAPVNIASLHFVCVGAPTAASAESKILLRTTPSGSVTAATALQINGNGSIYVTDNCSALSFTDRTDGYTGDALAALKTVKNDARGKIDHSTLPAFARKQIKKSREIVTTDAHGKPQTQYVTETEEGRDLGNMISILTVAAQQLMDEIKRLTDQNADLTKRIEKLEKPEKKNA